jgi:glycosyltransferase involved in cell wall biosynthesis
MSELSELRRRVQRCYEGGELEGALAACARLLEAEGESAEVLNDMGALCFQLGRAQESLRYLARAVVLDGENGEARQNLRMVCRATGTRPEAALAAAAPMPAAGPAADISVVVPAHSCFDVLDRCLDALHGQSMAADTFEVLVVGNGLTAQTAAELDAVLGRWGDAFGSRLRPLRIEEASIALARNEGIREARGRLVLQINQDTILPRTALQEHYDEHAGFGFDPACVVVGGRKFPDSYLASLFTYLHEAVPLYTPLHRPRPRFLGDHTWFVTCNLSAMREAYASFGMYDPQFAWGSDQALGRRWEQEHGARIYVNTNIVSYHLHRITFDSWKAKCIEGAPYWFKRNMGMAIEDLPRDGRRAVREELDSMETGPEAVEAELRRLETNFTGPGSFDGDVVMGRPAFTLDQLVYRLRPLLRDYRKCIQYKEIWRRIQGVHGPDGGLTAGAADSEERLSAALADLDLS